MPDPQDPASSGAILEPIQSPVSTSKRIRPPHPDAGVGESERVPLRIEAGEKARWRDSKLGLKNFFGRNRGASDAERGPASPRLPASPREASHRLGGIRASLADISGWHHTQGHRSEVSLPSLKSPPPVQSLRHKISASGVRPQPSLEGLAAWNPPPLFQAYPQAIKHASLPACTASAEVILRMHNHKSSASFGSILGQVTLTSQIPEEVTDDKGERPRRRHRRTASGSASKFEWTTKVFILVTSGYLLQYAGEGSFDRLPERVLQLGKESAAFASDVIPGRHWVLQVSSIAEPDRVTASHSSIRARLPFRGQERRCSSTILMVFESAEDMDSWIATLRREIEALGGRKVLSETGKPKTSDQDSKLKNQASQRTLVVRDPSRFSRVMSPEPPERPERPDHPWGQDLTPSSPDIHLYLAQDVHEQSFDDTSTASVISHDGRQLDALRDSTNRLSFISSGQRTGVTSAGSSPACSPTRDSFLEREPLTPDLSQIEEQPRPRLRPNATAINDRRQSLQTKNHVFEMRVATAPSLRPHSTSANSRQPEAAIPSASAPQPMPNFSVPHNAGIRYSYTRTMPVEPAKISSPPLVGRMGFRRPPPSVLSINPRPLSLVEDQPSPVFSQLNRIRSVTDSTGSPMSSAPLTPPMSSSSSHGPDSKSSGSESHDLFAHRSNTAARETFLEDAVQAPTLFARVRRFSIGQADVDLKESSITSPTRAALLEPLDIPRSRSALGTYGANLSPAQANPRPERRGRRLSSPSQRHDERLFPFSSPPSPLRVREPSLKPVPRSSQHLRVDSLVSPSLLQRRSMSQLAEGPPPGPPPTKALPPVPRKVSKVTIVPPPGFI
ncbi:PH domain-containing protein [Madurella fahalii]|uniref:PH domain-containing protein n=1 Tax=Madurella fahalii TaxID=1157608 RepID=A0ABQ0GMM9_9PEZI